MTAQGLPALNIENLDHQIVDQVADFLVAPAESSLADVRQADFRPIGPRDVNQGITAQTYWLRLRLDNPGVAPKRWVLHHETSYLDNVTVYAADEGAHMAETHLSDRRPFYERPLTYRKLAFEHETPAESYTDIYLRLNYDKADSVTLRFHLWERDSFHAEVAEENLIHGAYFGVMVALMAITLICIAILQRIIYVYYFAFLVFSALMWATLNGFTYQYVWPGSVFWHNEGFHIVFLLFALTALQFSKAFLKTQRTFPSIHQLFTVLQAIMLVGIALRFYGLYLPILILSFTSFSLLALLPLLGWLAYRRGLRYARWYALAWTVYALGLVLSVLSAATNLFSWGMQPLAYAQSASLIEAVLLLAALAERLKGLDLDRLQAIKLAHQDPLTGLGNRRLLTQSLEMFKTRFAQNQLPVYLLMIDLDHFKIINDTYGHEAGDAVLCAVANLLKRVSRAQDVCVRYGGEEFALLFQAPSHDIALQIAERIRTEFAQAPTLYDGQLISHTLSSGLIPIISDQEHLTAREMMNRADAALYGAKADGRNCTTVHAPDATASTPAPTAP